MNKEKILNILRNTPDEELFAEADAVRSQTCGDEVYIRAIIEFSNYCRCACEYCGLNVQNDGLSRYRMTLEQVIKASREAFDENVQTIVLQSGEDAGIKTDEICQMMESIKRIGDIAVTLSCGEYPYEDYRLMRNAGADRYLLKIETVNREIYHKLRPGCRFENRVRCLHDLRELGYQVGSGSLVGLPGQTLEDIADDILFCVNLDLEMATFSPFIPHPKTPLSDEPGGSWQLGLRVLATARIALPAVHIPVSTALASVSPDDYISPLNAGANVVMADVTPYEFVKYYDIYPGKAPVGFRKGRDSISRLKKIIESMGRPIGIGRGDALKKKSIDYFL